MKIEELRQFMSANFHEDWELAGSDEEVIAQFLSAYPTVSIRKTIANQIDTFAASYDNDSDLERDLYEVLGCCYVPSGGTMNSRKWLLWVRNRLLGK